MSKDAVIHARTDPQLKLEVEAIFQQLGLNTTAAINLFFQQVKLNEGLPFPVKIPNARLAKAMRDTDAGKNLIRCKDADDMFEKLGI